MDPPDSNANSFVVRIWLDDDPGAPNEGPWTGQITHVPSGRRRYFRELDLMSLFVAGYLEAMGARLSWKWRLRRWARRRPRSEPAPAVDGPEEPEGPVVAGPKGN